VLVAPITEKEGRLECTARRIGGTGGIIGPPALGEAKEGLLERAGPPGGDTIEDLLGAAGAGATGA
jgi:hypothetical protein